MLRRSTNCALREQKKGDNIKYALIVVLLLGGCREQPPQDTNPNRTTIIIEVDGNSSSDIQYTDYGDGVVQIDCGEGGCGDIIITQGGCSY